MVASNVIGDIFLSMGIIQQVLNEVGEIRVDSEQNGYIKIILAIENKRICSWI